MQATSYASLPHTLAEVKASGYDEESNPEENGLLFEKKRPRLRTVALDKRVIRPLKGKHQLRCSGKGDAALPICDLPDAYNPFADFPERNLRNNQV